MIPTFSKTQITVLPPKAKYPNCQSKQNKCQLETRTMKKIGKTVIY